MDESIHEWLQRTEREALARVPHRPAPARERPTIHYTELPEDTSGGPIATEWNFYRHEAGRLLAEGHEGKWVLIKGEQVIGIWETERAASQAAAQHFLMQPVLIRQILTREPLLRGPMFFRRCPN